MRDLTCKKLLSPHFIGVVGFILVNYYIFTFEFLTFLNPCPYSSFGRVFALVIFHLVFFMLVWSMVQSILADPGRVPIYWGFFAEESDDERRRYCLLCHSFKPERCHHCSTCQRCVLNMDHHCPWISNCVGYFNRKFFILFLSYVILATVVGLLIQVPMVIIELRGLGTKYIFSFHTVIRTVGAILQIGFFFVIVTFFKFHLELVMTNSTTLDNLERQRNTSVGPNLYNIGSYQNFVQVFGPNISMWPFPIFGPSSPVGDGVIWKKNRN